MTAPGGRAVAATATRLSLVAAVSIFVALLATEAQPTAKVPRIGVLLAGSPGANTLQVVEAFRQGLQGLGYVEGRTRLSEITRHHSEFICSISMLRSFVS